MADLRDVWTTFKLAAVWWLLGRWSLPAMLSLPIPFEIVSGNVHLLYAVAIVAGFRASRTLALPILTKVASGVGLLWFAARRAWRPFVLALAITGGIVLVSVMLDAQAWRQWIDVLPASSSMPSAVGWCLPVPLLLRLPIAVVVVVFAALTERRWLVAVAVVFAMPVLWLNSLAVLAACVPLWSGRLAVATDHTAIAPAEALGR